MPTPTPTPTRPVFLVDRAGVPRFIRHDAAKAWLTADPDHALQCPNPGCGDIYYDAWMECCDQGCAYPVRPVAHDEFLFETVPVAELTAITEGH
jgi:hypothetical protein